MMVNVVFNVFGEEHLSRHSVKDSAIDVWVTNQVALDVIVLVLRRCYRVNFNWNGLSEPTILAKRWTPMIKRFVEAVLP